MKYLALLIALTVFALPARADTIVATQMADGTLLIRRVRPNRPILHFLFPRFAARREAIRAALAYPDAIALPAFSTVTTRTMTVTYGAPVLPAPQVIIQFQSVPPPSLPSEGVPAPKKAY